MSILSVTSLECDKITSLLNGNSGNWDWGCGFDCQNIVKKLAIENLTDHTIEISIYSSAMNQIFFTTKDASSTFVEDSIPNQFLQSATKYIAEDMNTTLGCTAVDYVALKNLEATITNNNAVDTLEVCTSEKYSSSFESGTIPEYSNDYVVSDSSRNKTYSLFDSWHTVPSNLRSNNRAPIKMINTTSIDVSNLCGLIYGDSVFDDDISCSFLNDHTNKNFEISVDKKRKEFVAHHSVLEKKESIDGFNSESKQDSISPITMSYSPTPSVDVFRYLRVILGGKRTLNLWAVFLRAPFEEDSNGEKINEKLYNFRFYFEAKPYFMHEKSNSYFLKRYSVACKYKTVQCILSITSQVQQDLGECSVGDFTTAKFRVKNLSILPAKLIPYVESETLGVSRSEIIIQPNESKVVSFDYVPKLENIHYCRRAFLFNVYNPRCHFLVEVRASNIDTRQVLQHSLFYKILTYNNKRQLQLFFDYSFINLVNVRYFCIRNNYARPLWLQLSSKNSDIRVITLTPDSMKPKNNNGEKKILAERKFKWIEEIKWGGSPLLEARRRSQSLASDCGPEFSSKLPHSSSCHESLDSFGSIPISDRSSESKSNFDELIERGILKRSSTSMNSIASSSSASGLNLPGISKQVNEAPSWRKASDPSFPFAFCTSGSEVNIESTVREIQSIITDLSEFSRYFDAPSGKDLVCIGVGCTLECIAIFFPSTSTGTTDLDCEDIDRVIEISLVSVGSHDVEIIRSGQDIGDIDFDLQHVDPSIDLSNIYESQEWISVHGSPLMTRYLPLKAKISRSSLTILQKNINFGRVSVGETTVRTVEMVNRSPFPALYSISKSGSISSGYLRISCGGKGFVPPNSSKEIEFVFRPLLSGAFEESLLFENVLEPSNKEILVIKAKIVKPNVFQLSQWKTVSSMPSADIPLFFPPVTLSVLDSINDESQGSNISSGADDSSNSESGLAPYLLSNIFVGEASPSEINFKVRNLTSRPRQIIVDVSNTDSVSLVPSSNESNSLFEPIPEVLQAIVGMRCSFNGELLKSDAISSLTEEMIRKLEDNKEKFQQKLKIAIRKQKADKILKYEKKLRNIEAIFAGESDATEALNDVDEEDKEKDKDKDKDKEKDNEKKDNSVDDKKEKKEKKSKKKEKDENIYINESENDVATSEKATKKLADPNVVEEAFYNNNNKFESIDRHNEGIGSLSLKSSHMSESGEKRNKNPDVLKIVGSSDFAFHCIIPPYHDVGITAKVKFLPGPSYKAWIGELPFRCSMRVYECRNEENIKNVSFGVFLSPPRVLSSSPISSIESCLFPGTSLISLPSSQLSIVPSLLITLPPWCSVPTKHYNNQFRELQQRITGDTLNIILESSKSKHFMGSFTITTIPLRNVSYLLKNRVSISTVAGSRLATPLSTSKYVVYDRNNHGEFTISFGSDATSKEILSDEGVSVDLVAGNSIDVNVIFSPVESLSVDTIISGLFCIQSYEADSPNSIPIDFSVIYLPFFCFLEHSSSIKTAKSVNFGEMLVGKLEILKLKISNSSKSDTLSYITIIPPNVDEVGIVDVILNQTGILEPGASTELVLQCSAVSGGKLEKELWIVNMNDRFDKKKVNIHASILLPQCHFINFPDFLENGSMLTSLDTIDMGKIQFKVKEFLFSHKIIGSDTNSSEIDTKKYHYVLRIKNVHQERLFLTAVSNLKSQCQLFVDEQCSIPAITYPIDSGEILSLYILICPPLKYSSLEYSKSVANNKKSRIEKQKEIIEKLIKGRMLIGGIRLVFFVADCSVGSEIQLENPDNSSTVSIFRPDITQTFRKFYETSFQVQATIGLSVLTINNLMRDSPIYISLPVLNNGANKKDIFVQFCSFEIENKSPTFSLDYILDDRIFDTNPSFVGHSIDSIRELCRSRSNMNVDSSAILQLCDSCHNEPFLVSFSPNSGVLQQTQKFEVLLGIVYSLESAGFFEAKISLINRSTSALFSTKIDVFFDPRIIQFGNREAPISADKDHYCCKIALKGPIIVDLESQEDPFLGLESSDIQFNSSSIATSLSSMSISVPEKIYILGSTVGEIASWEIVNFSHLPVIVTPVSDLPLSISFVTMMETDIEKLLMDRFQKKTTVPAAVQIVNSKSLFSIGSGLWKGALAKCGDTVRLSPGASVKVSAKLRSDSFLTGKSFQDMINMDILTSLTKLRDGQFVDMKGVVAFVGSTVEAPSLKSSLFAVFEPPVDSSTSSDDSNMCKKVLWEKYNVLLYSTLKYQIVKPLITIPFQSLYIQNVRSGTIGKFDFIIENPSSVKIPIFFENLPSWLLLREKYVVVEGAEITSRASFASNDSVSTTSTLLDIDDSDDNSTIENNNGDNNNNNNNDDDDQIDNTKSDKFDFQSGLLDLKSKSYYDENSDLSQLSMMVAHESVAGGHHSLTADSSLLISDIFENNQNFVALGAEKRLTNMIFIPENSSYPISFVIRTPHVDSQVLDHKFFIRNVFLESNSSFAKLSSSQSSARVPIRIRLSIDSSEMFSFTSTSGESLPSRGPLSSSYLAITKPLSVPCLAQLSYLGSKKLKVDLPSHDLSSLTSDKILFDLPPSISRLSCAYPVASKSTSTLKSFDPNVVVAKFTLKNITNKSLLIRTTFEPCETLSSLICSQIVISGLLKESSFELMAEEESEIRVHFRCVENSVTSSEFLSQVLIDGLDLRRHTLSPSKSFRFSSANLKRKDSFHQHLLESKRNSFAEKKKSQESVDSHDDNSLKDEESDSDLDDYESSNESLIDEDMGVDDDVSVKSVNNEDLNVSSFREDMVTCGKWQFLRRFGDFGNIRSITKTNPPCEDVGPVFFGKLTVAAEICNNNSNDEMPCDLEFNNDAKFIALEPLVNGLTSTSVMTVGNHSESADIIGYLRLQPTLVVSTLQGIPLISCDTMLFDSAMLSPTAVALPEKIAEEMLFTIHDLDTVQHILITNYGAISKDCCIVCPRFEVVSPQGTRDLYYLSATPSNSVIGAMQYLVVRLKLNVVRFNSALSMISDYERVLGENETESVVDDHGCYFSPLFRLICPPSATSTSQTSSDGSSLTSSDTLEYRLPIEIWDLNHNDHPPFVLSLVLHLPSEIENH